jgi:hypothetical protein
MAVKHAIIKPLRHAGVAAQDRVYISGGAITEGAPVVFSGGKVSEFNDSATGPTTGSRIVGIALNATTGANQDVLVALALPNRRFVASKTGLSANGQSDTGATAIALADIGSVVALHKDATTGRWVLGAGGGGSGAIITGLVDKVGSTTNDAPSFGEAGSGSGVSGTPPNATFQGDPVAGPNFGLAREEFCFPVSTTLWQ